MLNVELIESTILVLAIALARIGATFILIPMLSSSVMGGNLIKNGVAMNLAVFLFPLVHEGYIAQEWSNLDITIILLKETFIGILIGYSVAIIFWGIEAVGFFIDNQRGATMASSLNPLTGAQTSPFGILLSQALVTIFFVTGGILVFLGSLYTSYQVWPVFSFYPNIGPELVDVFLGLLDLLMYFMLLIAAPVVIAMFMAEFGLAMVGRFAPQMDVFFLAMPIKSAIATGMLIVYVSTLLYFFKDKLTDVGLIFTNLQHTI